MKRFIKKIALFLLFAVLVYLILLILSGNFAPKAVRNLYYPIGFNHLNEKMKDARQTRDVDILFVGSSHAEQGFDTRIFEARGFSCFNLGTSAQTPIQTEMLLNRYLDEMNPKIVVYDVYPGIFTIDGVEAALRLIANDKNDKYSVEMALTTNNVKLYNTLIYAFYRDFFYGNRATDSSKLLPSEGALLRGGYILKEETRMNDIIHYDSAKWVYEPKQFRQFEKTLQKLREKNIDVFLVQTPMTAAYYNSYRNNAAFDDYMSTKGSYFNFNRLISLNDTLHFSDKDHLNQAGIEIYDNALIELLLEIDLQ